jgi:modulator of FtsH protease HflC
MNPKQISLLVALAAVVILIGASAYTVDEREQAVITRLGEVRESVQESGLHFKTPFVEDVHTFSNMMLASDPTTVDQIYTADKKILLLDNYAIWQIVEPVKYLQAFPGGSYNAERRLGEVIFSALRQELGRHTQDEVVVTQRETIMDSVTAISHRAMEPMGIRVADVRIKRADLPNENARSVYGRMVAERQREATRYRSNGGRESERIRAETDRDAEIMIAQANRYAEQTRGQGDAGALKTYADAYQRGAEFYEFTRTLQAYESSIDSNSVMVLTEDNPFLKYFSYGSRGR